MRKWSVSKFDKERASEIADKYDIPMLIAMLLNARGVNSDDKIRNFLFNDSYISDPFEIKDMDKATERIKLALDNFEPICIYGDYDADGVTATALLYSYLEAIGANVTYYIPSRENEGYGLNKPAVSELYSRNVSLIITVDNGISANEEIDFANSLGIDTVITDHHMPTSKIPNACAVIDLHQEDCNSTFKELSGVGVVFKLIMALEGDYCDTQTLLDNYADIACIGTIGDIVALKGENRILVKNGLKNLKNTDKCGILAILQESGLMNRKITAGSVAFTVVPRINACGRLALSEKSVSLLLTDDEMYAQEIALELGKDNLLRKEIEKKILLSIEKRIMENPRIIKDKIIVIDGDDWHQGVIGIVAARIKETFNKPCIIISRSGDIAKGSGRSIEGFALCDALFSCSDLLTHHGGHPMAVGFSLNSTNIDTFRARINQYAENISVMPLPELNIDCKLNPAALNVSIVSELSYLEPYGAGNPTPVFGLYNMKITQIKPLSDNRHIRLTLSRTDCTINALQFGMGTDAFPYAVDDIIDLAVTLDKNEYNGTENLSVIIKDIKFSDANNEKMLLEREIYDRFSCELPISKEEAELMLPTRSEFAAVYRYLKSRDGYTFSIDSLVHRLDNKVNFSKLLIIIDVLNECGLISFTQHLNCVIIKMLNVSGKADLNDTKIMQKLRGLC